MNILESIFQAQKMTNDNVVALSDNLNVVNDKLDKLMAMFATPPQTPPSEPTTLGAEAKKVNSKVSN